jgi:fibrillarin-like rRNA methylase
METPRSSLDAALPVVESVENLQKYRYILENIDGIFRDFS